MAKIDDLEKKLDTLQQGQELNQMHIDVLQKQLQTLETSLERYRSRVYELEHLIVRYHALLDVWDLDIPEHVPFSIAEAAEQEKMALQGEAAKIKPN